MWAIIFSAGLATTPVFSMPAFAQGPALVSENLQQMTYEVYAGGINAVSAKLKVDYADKKDNYSLEVSAQTKGLLGKLAPWEGTFETKGWHLKDGKEVPELHRSTATWRDEKEIKTYEYGKDGSFKDYTVVEEGRDKTPQKLDEGLYKDTTDALTATLEVMKSVADKGECEGAEEVFDGNRRYKLVFSHGEQERLESSRYNIYDGESVRCEVEVQPISGAWHKKPRGWMSIQEQGRDKGSLPTVWFAKIDEDGPAVPVKIRVKTDYGTLFMHLVDYKNGGQAIKMAED